MLVGKSNKSKKEHYTVFTETCIKRFEEIQEELYKDPTQFAKFVSNIEDEVKKLGIKIIQETLETMDKEIQNS